MKRTNGWERRLRTFLGAAAAWEYDPVQAHCAHFILGVLGAITAGEPLRICEDLDIALPADEGEIAELLEARGGMRGLAAEYFGTPARTDMLNAREGDIAVLDGDTGETLGVVEGGGVLCVAADRGLTRVWLHQAKGFWAL